MKSPNKNINFGGLPLRDVQNLIDNRGIDIQKVGIKNE